jgi:hypothetical protein
MQIIAHRLNTLSSLEALNLHFGGEIDIRYHDNNLVLAHDPFQHHIEKPISFESFLLNWRAKGPLILNIKTEGIELECIKLINKYGIKSWFFLDLSMPYFIKYSKLAKENSIDGFSVENLAVRFSDKEPIEYALNFKNFARWVWVDWFDDIVLNEQNYQNLKDANFRLCLVSPELQGKRLELIEEYKEYLKSSKLDVDAVCTKRPDLWK